MTADADAASVGGSLADDGLAQGHGDPGAGLGSTGDHGTAFWVDADDVEPGTRGAGLRRRPGDNGAALSLPVRG